MALKILQNTLFNEHQDNDKQSVYKVLKLLSWI